MAKHPSDNASEITEVDKLIEMTKMAEPSRVANVSLSLETIEFYLDSPIENSKKCYDLLFNLPERWFDKNKQNEFCRQFREFIYGDRKSDELEIVKDPEKEKEFLLSLPPEWFGNSDVKHDEYALKTPRVRDFFELCFFLRRKSFYSSPREAGEIFSLIKGSIRSKRNIRQLLPWEHIWRDVLNPGTDLSGIKFHMAVFRKTKFNAVTLQKVTFRGADLRDSDFRGADLRRADLFSADLRGADLRGADLCRADLFGADLRGADLRGAKLHGAIFRWADLRGADFPEISFDFIAHFLPVKADGESANDKKESIQNLEVIVKALKSIELFQLNDRPISISIFNIYKKFTNYISFREERRGLNFFQPGDTCNVQKLDFIIHVGRVLLESLHSFSPRNELMNVITNLKKLASKANTVNSDILRPRIGCYEYSLKAHFEELVESIQQIYNIQSKYKSDQNVQYNQLTEKEKQWCEGLGIESQIDMSGNSYRIDNF